MNIKKQNCIKYLTPIVNNNIYDTINHLKIESDLGNIYIIDYSYLCLSIIDIDFLFNSILDNMINNINKNDYLIILNYVPQKPEIQINLENNTAGIIYSNDIELIAFILYCRIISKLGKTININLLYNQRTNNYKNYSILEYIYKYTEVNVFKVSSNASIIENCSLLNFDKDGLVDVITSMFNNVITCNSNDLIHTLLFELK